MTAPVRVVSSVFPPGTGWDPVTLLGRLLARLLDADLVEVAHTRSGHRLAPALARLPRVRRGPVTTLVLAPQPVHLYALLDLAHWLPGSGRTAGWVVDSFLTDRVPAVARGRGHLDHLFVTGAEDVPAWRAATGGPVSWLPWGSDVLGRGDGGADRPVDVLRVGRQPEGWADDDAVRRLLGGAGLTHGGRPPFGTSAPENQDLLMAAERRAKLTLSFTSRLSPAAYTHPDREYLTGRWLDALASGARVAGVAPACAATDRLLWPGATLDLGGADPHEGVHRLAAAVRDWSPQVPADVHREALARLDWRWRITELVELLGLDAPRLEADLARLRTAAGQGEVPPSR